MKLSEDEILAARILIVDDQPANVRLLERLLADAGYRAVSATMDPREVAALHASHDYDAILLDLQMPGLDGFEVMAALRRDEVDGVLPVIVLTAQPQHKLRALQAGARDFISKPFDLVEVKTRIHHMLETRLLYRRLAAHAQLLEAAVQARTAELRASEARYRSLTELASDWHWHQDERGELVSACGPVGELLGLAQGPAAAQPGEAVMPLQGWNERERDTLRAAVAARQPFIDLPVSRVDGNGTQHRYRVSGEPMFTQACRFIGYRGVGVEVTTLAP